MHPARMAADVMRTDRHTSTPADSARYEANRGASYDVDSRPDAREIRADMAGLSDGCGERGELTDALERVLAGGVL